MPTITEDFNDGQKVDGDRLDALVTQINNGFSSIEVSEGPLNITARGADPAADPADNVTAIQTAWDDAAATTNGAVWMNTGAYPIDAKLTRPQGLRIDGPGAYACRLTTDQAIVMVQMGPDMAVEGYGDRYVSSKNFGVDGGGVALKGFLYSPAVIFNDFENLTAFNINGPGHALDGSQNSRFVNVNSDGCDVGLALLNDAGSNTFDRSEYLNNNVTGLLMDDDNTLDGYDLARFQNTGPSQNHFGNVLIEYGSMTTAAKLVKGTFNVFDGACNFVGYNGTALQYLIDLGANAHFNVFDDIRLNGNSAAVSGYSAFLFAVRNAGYRNRFVNPYVELQSLGTGNWLTTSNAIEIIEPHLGGAYRVQHTGVGDTKVVMFRPKADQAFGDTASRPNFGDVGPFTYWNTETHRPNFYQDGTWYDPSSGGGGGDVEFTHTQASPASTWTISNTLGRYPSSVSVWIGDEEVEAVVETPDVSTIVITFASAQSGRAEII